MLETVLDRGREKWRKGELSIIPHKIPRGHRRESGIGVRFCLRGSTTSRERGGGGGDEADKSSRTGLTSAGKGRTTKRASN